MDGDRDPVVLFVDPSDELGKVGLHFSQGQRFSHGHKYDHAVGDSLALPSNDKTDDRGRASRARLRL